MTTPPRQPIEIGDADEPSGIQPHVAGYRYNIAAWITRAFVGGLGFFAVLLLAVVSIEAFGPNSVGSYLSFDDILKLFTTFGTLMGGILGYVLGHYFRAGE